MALLGTTKNGRQQFLSCNEPVSRSETELGNCPSGGSWPAGIMTASSETSMTTNNTASMAVVGVPFKTMSGEASLDEAPRSPHLVPKPPSQFVLDSESVFEDEELCLPVRVVSDATQGGKERAGRKRYLEKLDSVGPSTPTHKRRNSLPLSKQTPVSAHGEAFLSPMVSGVSRTPLRINHSEMAALEVPSPSSSVLSTPTRCQGEGLVGGASPSPAAAKGDVM